LRDDPAGNQIRYAKQQVRQQRAIDRAAVVGMNDAAALRCQANCNRIRRNLSYLQVLDVGATLDHYVAVPDDQPLRVTAPRQRPNQQFGLPLAAPKGRREIQMANRRVDA
jgi:hypothetical protein